RSRVLHEREASAFVEPFQAGRSVLAHSGQKYAQYSFAEGFCRRFKKHVDGRPRMQNRRLRRECKMRIVYKNMIIRRPHENLSFFDFELVIDLDHGQLNITGEKRAEEFRLLETAVLHHDDREWEIVGQISQHGLECIEAGEGRTDD